MWDYAWVNYCNPPFNCGGFRVNPTNREWNIMSFWYTLYIIAYTM